MRILVKDTGNRVKVWARYVAFCCKDMYRNYESRLVNAEFVRICNGASYEVYISGMSISHCPFCGARIRVVEEDKDFWESHNDKECSHACDKGCGCN
jgi:hypothetical protein